MDLTAALLWFCVALFAGGSVALLLVRWTTPSLRGTTLLSLAAALGAISSAVLGWRGDTGWSSLFVDAGLLTAFLLLHRGARQLFPQLPGSLRRGCLVLSTQVLVNVLCCCGLLVPKAHVISFGILLALQASWTALVLWRHARTQVHAPATFSVVTLLGLCGFNLYRSTVEFLTYHQDLHAGLTFAALVTFLAGGLCIAFGFFWMTTATLTAEVEQMASTDPLTRLYNRRLFLKWCEREWARALRGVPFSILLIDLDHFKRVNDEFGHAVGDQVLCAAVERMQDSVRGIDVLCRWGGEEFAVLLPSANAEATRLVAERIRENVQTIILPLSPQAPYDSDPFSLTASIGSANFRGEPDTIASMLQRADNALYKAKQTGRNRVLEAA